MNWVRVLGLIQQALELGRALEMEMEMEAKRSCRARALVAILILTKDGFLSSGSDFDKVIVLVLVI